MVNEKIIGCMRESEVDTSEIALRKRMEDFLSEGDIEAAEKVEDAIKGLDHVPICEEPEDKTRGFAMMMRDRARYL